MMSSEAKVFAQGIYLVFVAFVRAFSGCEEYFKKHMGCKRNTSANIALKLWMTCKKKSVSTTHPGNIRWGCKIVKVLTPFSEVLKPMIDNPRH